jgi:UDP-hydrolysing UDP-N-acetyl-D-glucosamine 2-epimerase
VLVVSSGRADRTPLEPVIEELAERVGLVITPSLEGLSPADCVTRTAEFIRRDSPDLMLVLGDRFETLGACYAATYAKVPIAHIHGGEATHGAFDDHIRHAITKLSHLHFAAAEPYAERLRRMGERRVWTVGTPGLDNLTDLPPRVPTKTFVVTYHPPTLGECGAKQLVEALKRFPDYEVIWTGVNNDPGAESVRASFAGYAERHLTPHQYVLSCRHAAAVIGNSSSGIIECPSLEVPSVDVGTRQAGRLRGKSVMNAGDNADSIAFAIERALNYYGPFDNPYGKPGASKAIADILSEIDLTNILVKPWSM